MSTKTKEATRAKTVSSKSKATAASNGGAKHKKRLRPGELNGLVLSYMCKHEGELPLTASAIGKGIENPPAPSPTASLGWRKPKRFGWRKRLPARTT